MLTNAISTVKEQWHRCRYWAGGAFIAGYLTILGGGLLCHTFSWKVSAHPMMYFVVWDMFCGWSSYESRYHVVAEGVSGTYYQVLPGPWGDFQPYGDLSRHHYDIEGSVSGRLAMNVLRHTDHEDITRMFIVEQAWPKKFNMPDDQWASRWDEPKDPRHYYTLRHVITPQGLVLQSYASFYQQQFDRDMSTNPRLVAEMTRSQPFYAVNLVRDDAADNGFGEDVTGPRFGSPQGN